MRGAGSFATCPGPVPWQLCRLSNCWAYSLFRNGGGIETWLCIFRDSRVADIGPANAPSMCEVELVDCPAGHECTSGPQVCSLSCMGRTMGLVCYRGFTHVGFSLPTRYPSRLQLPLSPLSPSPVTTISHSAVVLCNQLRPALRLGFGRTLLVVEACSCWAPPCLADALSIWALQPWRQQRQHAVHALSPRHLRDVGRDDAILVFRTMCARVCLRGGIHLPNRVPLQSRAVQRGVRGHVHILPRGHLRRCAGPELRCVLGRVRRRVLLPARLCQPHGYGVWPGSVLPGGCGCMFTVCTRAVLGRVRAGVALHDGLPRGDLLCWRWVACRVCGVHWCCGLGDPCGVTCLCCVHVHAVHVHSPCRGVVPHVHFHFP